MTRLALFILSACLASVAPAYADEPTSQPTTRPTVRAKDIGYRGIWYANEPLDSPYKYKYSGGLGTYCAKHIPLAYYAEKVHKTFFVYGGTQRAEDRPFPDRTLLIMVSYYDHTTGCVPRPTILMDKQTSDAHDNPTIMLDETGYVWVFVAAHGTARPAYIFKSVEPYSVDAFEMIKQTNFSYPQPWYIDGKGFLFLHTRYTKRGRQLFAITSQDGQQWSEPQSLASIGKGHYQISWRYKDKIGTAFNYHPDEGGLNHRTNLYYMETKDFGKTWQSAGGKKLELPLTDVQNDALVRDYARLKRLVYLKDLTFDPRGNPVILYLTSGGFEPGPRNGPRLWSVARWTGREWEMSGVVRSDNNYDTGCLFVERIDFWRLIAPTGTGPQRFNPGGEVDSWTTNDLGRSWYRQRLTADSKFNHTYVRRVVNAHRDFEVFWADGDGRRPSESRLYFADQDRNVYRLPTVMTEDFAKPEKLPMVVEDFEYKGPTRPAPDDAK